MTGDILGLLCLLLFLLIAFRKVLTAAFRQSTSAESSSADDRFREIIEREKQRMKDEDGNAESESTHRDPP
jgi:UPF0716 family protein affecting phage T7 exclusion